MQRTARLDAPGVLHHVMIRGIERQKIFRNDKDREDFIERLEVLCPETQTSFYGWAFMSNHAHFLFRTGRTPLSRLMRRLLTGYVIGFNRRHKRGGQLFQNRYKSIVCQDDAYLQELVRYVHLNPVRARIVKTLDELKTYKYCGHSSLMGKTKRNWQDTDYVLSYFGKRKTQARKVRARSLLCFCAARELGMSHTFLAKRLEMSSAGVGFSVERGESIAKKGNYLLRN